MSHATESTSPNVVIIGLGQMGSVFAHALLRRGATVHPVTRAMSARDVAQRCPEPELVLIAAGEADLPQLLKSLPIFWRSRVGLLQNELLPRDWRAHGIERPTVAVVWFEKKKTIATKVILPTPVSGPRARLLVEALGELAIEAEVIPEEQLPAALVAKNLYILVANIAGLAADADGSGATTVGTLVGDHPQLVRSVGEDVLALQQALLADLPASERPVEAMPLDRAAAWATFERAVAADPDHGARGRSAPARLARALAHAERLGIQVPTLARIEREQSLPRSN